MAPVDLVHRLDFLFNNFAQFTVQFFGLFGEGRLLQVDFSLTDRVPGVSASDDQRIERTHHFSLQLSHVGQIRGRLSQFLLHLLQVLLVCLDLPDSFFLILLEVVEIIKDSFSCCILEFEMSKA